MTQVPALIVSIAAGFLVSKSGVEGSADKALVAQLATNPVSLGMVSAAAGVVGLIPGMPMIPFAALAIGAGVLAWRMGHKKPEPEASTETKLTGDEEEPIATALAIDDVKIELGYGLLTLINDLEGRRLTDQIRALRRTLAGEYGFVMPPVRILDNMRLPNQGYAIRVTGEMEARAAKRNSGLPDGHGSPGQTGRTTRRTRARTGVRPSRHLDRRRPARGGDLPRLHHRRLPLTAVPHQCRPDRDPQGQYGGPCSTRRCRSLFKKDLPTAEQKKLVDDLVPSVVTATTVQRVLQSLLRERVSIRDLPTILEGIAEAAPHTTSVTQLVEHVRTRLAKQLCFQNKGDDASLPIVTLSPNWESAFHDSLIGPGEEKQLALAPSKLQEFIGLVREVFERAALNGDAAVLLTSPAIRPYVRSLIERFRGQTTVMSQNEIHPRAKLKTVGTI